MFELLQVLTLLAVVVTLTPALAHALEYPGKLRLKREDYLTVQPIYYPGFTFAGIAEPLSVILLAILAYLTQNDTAFWLTLGAMFCILIMHALYWTLTHPVNNFWLADFELSGFGAKFFGADFAGRRMTEKPEWTWLRDRWEISHIARAALAVLGFVLLASAVVID